MNTNESKQKFFLIYQITNLITGMIYVGAHATFNINDKYLGSSKPLKKDIKELGRQNFKKEILHVFDNKEEMVKMEAKIVNREFCYRVDTYNKMIGGVTDFTWQGMIVAKDNDGKIHSIYATDPRYLSGELFGIGRGNSYGKNKVSVKDKEGNTFQVDVTDPRYLSGELVHVSTGLPGNCSWQGRKHSEESKQKIGSSNSISQKGEKNSQFGKARTEEFKKGVKEKLSHSFFVYDLQGNFISEEKNIKEYAKLNGLNPSSICKVLNGTYKQTGSLIFKKEQIKCLKF